MTKSDGIMLGLYLMIFALGVEMMSHGSNVGIAQVGLISVLFPLRLYMILKRRQRS